VTTAELVEEYDPSVDVILREACWSTAVAARVVSELPDTAVMDAARRPLMEALRALVAEGAPVAPDTVLARVTIDRLPGWDQTCRLMADIMLGGVNSGTVGYHLELVQETASRTRLQQLAMVAADVSHGGVTDAVATIRERLDRIVTRKTQAPPTVASLLDNYLDRLETPDTTATIPTGLPPLDHILTGGFRPGQFVLVGAASGAGKSFLLALFARAAALHAAATTVFHSLEMSRNELLDRIVSAEARIDLTKLTGRNLAETDWSRLVQRLDDIKQGRLHIDDTAGRTLNDIRTTCTPLQPKLIIIDYLQLMTPGKETNRQEQVAGISRGLKLLARDLECTVIAATQLNRAGVQRADKRPQLSDVRESSGPVNDADIVMLLDRDSNDDTYGTTATLNVPKQRNGPLGTVNLTFAGHYSRFDAAPTPHLLAAS
jgi:replicative DNA helicase